jgi:hypothetical protein
MLVACRTIAVHLDVELPKFDAQSFSCNKVSKS